MLDFQIPRITSEHVEENRGSFAIEPLDRGFGYTFGNSLRRVLLSSLADAAVTSVRIEGVAHEFSTIKGVTEDVTDIVLNLKGIVCRMVSITRRPVGRRMRPISASALTSSSSP